MYKVSVPMLSWMLHKLTGFSIVGFLIFHIWGMSQMSQGPDAFNRVIETYKTPLFKVGEILLLGAMSLASPASLAALPMFMALTAGS